MTYEGAVLDIDGTILRGDELLPGAREGLGTLADRNIRRVFVTNNPVDPPPAYGSRFATAGVDVDPDEVVTAGTVTVEYLLANHPDERVFVVGDGGLVGQLEDAGVSVVHHGDDPDVLVASIDRGFSYDTLAAALSVLEDDAVSFVGTDPDMVIPAAEGRVPGSGAVIHAIAGVADRDPDTVLGKPSDETLRATVDRLGVPAQNCILVGDRLDTDVAMGERAGMTTVLVRTGIADDEDLESSPVRPDVVLDSLAELDDVFDD